MDEHAPPVAGDYTTLALKLSPNMCLGSISHLQADTT